MKRQTNSWFLLLSCACEFDNNDLKANLRNFPIFLAFAYLALFIQMTSGTSETK